MPSAVVFWIVAALVVIVTLGVLLRALLARHPADEAPADDSASVAIFRDQKRQLDEDLGNGVIDSAEHARMQEELAKRLGHEVDHPAPAARPTTTRARWIVAVALIVIVPITAGALYFALGRPGAIDAERIAAARPQLSQAQVLAMVETLAQRMKDNPADPKGWALLGRSYAALGRFDDAANAFDQATQRAPNDPMLWADYADTLSMAQASLQGKPTELTQKSLAIDPHNQKALALAAASASERHAYDEALDHWRTLAADLPADSDASREVAVVIADTIRQRDAAKAGGAATPSIGAGAAGSASSVAATTPTPNRGQTPISGQTTPTPLVATARISGTVSLSPTLAARARPSDTVFIFARAVDGARMPLAVLRTTVRELPRTFVLDDSMAMAPGATISSAKSVVVEARVSKSGNATPVSGDLVGKSGPANPGNTNIHVEIDAVNP